MLKKNIMILILALICGGLNCIPYLFSANITYITYLSTLVLWTVNAFIIAHINLNLSYLLTGTVTSILINLPSWLYMLEKSLFAAFMNMLWLIISGSILGVLIGKIKITPLNQHFFRKH